MIVAKGFLKLPNMHMLIKQKSPSLPRNLAAWTLGELPILFSTKINLLYLLYSTTRRCCLLHLIKQNCLLKTFLKTLILMTEVSLYLFSFLERGKAKHELRVTSSNPRVTSSNSEVKSSNPRVKTPNPRVTSSDPRVTSSNPRVRRLKARVGRLKARVRRLKARVEAIKPRVK